MMPQGANNQRVGGLAPMAALVALALGVGALMAPLPFLSAPSEAIDLSELPPAAGRPKPVIKPIVPEDWAPLAEKFAKLREPPQVIAEVPTDETAPQIETQPTPVASSNHQPLRWKYLGCVTEPGRNAGLVLMNEMNQRFLYPGQELVDETDPEQLTIRVVSVSEKEIVVEREGVQERFTLMTDTSESPFLPDAYRNPNNPAYPKGANPHRASPR